MSTRTILGFKSYDESTVGDFWGGPVGDSDITVAPFPLNKTGEPDTLYGATPAPPHAVGGIQIWGLGDGNLTMAGDGGADAGYNNSSTNYVGIAFLLHIHDVLGTGDSVTAGYTAHPDGQAAPIYMNYIRIVWTGDVSDNRVQASIQYKPASLWVTFAGPGAWIDLDTDSWKDNLEIWELQVDKNLNKARLLRKNSDYISWTAAPGTPAPTLLVANPPSPGAYHVSGQAKNNDDISQWLAEEIVYQSDDLDGLDWGTGDGGIVSDAPGVYTRYPVADVAGYDDWTVTGNPDAGCATDAWRVVRDPEPSDPKKNDYISATADGEQDQLFEIGDCDSGATIYAVYISYVTKHAAAGDELVIAGCGGTPIQYTPVQGLHGNFGHCGYVFLQKTPESTPVAWTEAKFNALQAGVRVASGKAGIVYSLHVGVLGTGLSRPTPPAACGAAPPAAFRPRIMHYDAPIEYNPAIDGIPIGGCCS